MGVSGLLRWTKGVIDTKQNPTSIDHLYIDFYGIIYYCVSYLNYRHGIDMEILRSMTDDELYDVWISKIIEETKILITKISPTKSVTIVMDGVTPILRTIGKHYYLENVEFIKNLERDINLHFDETPDYFDKTKVYVCSQLLDKLSNKIREEISLKSFGDISVSLSDSRIPGEGEQKIFDLINLLDPESDEKISIFGNDSDIIVLSLLQRKKNIFFQFEEVVWEKIGEEMNKLTYIRSVNIDELYNNIFNLFNENMEKINSTIKFEEEEKGRIIDDFCFLTFFLGNDFIYRVPALKIYDIIGHYCKVFVRIRQFIVTRGIQTTLNNSFVAGFLEIIGENEQESLRQFHSSRYRFNLNNRNNRQIEEQSDYDKEKEMLRKTFENPRYPKCFSRIDYRFPNWKVQYYHFLLRIDDHYEEKLRENCQMFFEAIIFYVRLYFDRVTPWNWYKKVYASPPASDLADYLLSCNINSHQVEIGEPLNALVHLLVSHGRTKIEEIPPCMRDGLMDTFFDQYYPQNKIWFCYEKDDVKDFELITPRFDISRFQQVYEENKHLLSDEEKRRFNLD